MLLQEIQNILNLSVERIVKRVGTEFGKTEIIQFLPTEKQGAHEGELIMFQLRFLQGKEGGKQCQKPGIFRFCGGYRVDAVEPPLLQWRKVDLTVGRKISLCHTKVKYKGPVTADRSTGPIHRSVDLARRNKDPLARAQRERAALHLKIYQPLLQIKYFCLRVTVEIESTGFSLLHYCAVEGKRPGGSAVYDGLQRQGILYGYVLVHVCGLRIFILSVFVSFDLI